MAYLLMVIPFLALVCGAVGYILLTWTLGAIYASREADAELGKPVENEEWG